LKAINFKIAVVTVFSLLVYLIQADGKAQGSSSSQSTNLITKEEAEIVQLTNGKRRKRGLKPLIINMQLVCLARKQSANMARNNQLSHTVNGKTLAHRIEKSRYPYRYIGENVARSKRSPPHVIKMWMKSQGHRVNILNPNFREIGIGIIKAKNGDKYFTQIYGTPR
jgi:uncharacterized protein YkwD